MPPMIAKVKCFIEKIFDGVQKSFDLSPVKSLHFA